MKPSKKKKRLHSPSSPKSVPSTCSSSSFTSFHSHSTSNSNELSLAEVRRRRARLAHPFLPSSKSPNIIGRPIPLSANIDKNNVNTKMTDHESDSDEKVSLPPLVDAETGEELSFTKSKWTAKEGRVNLNSKCIIEMGTGRMNIFKTSSDVNNSFISDSFPMHELVSESINNGPLRPMFHRFWNAKYDEIIIPENYHRHDNDDVDEDKFDDSQILLNLTATSTSIGDISMSSPSILPSLSQSIDFSPSHTPNQPRSRNSSRPPSSSKRQSTANESSNQDAKVAMDNYDWDFLQGKLYQDLYELVKNYELNKKWTKEEWTTKANLNNKSIKAACRDLVNMKLKAMKEVVQAVADEEDRENKRIEDEEECSDPKKRKELIKVHNEQRHRSRIYLRSLQHDNEIVFLSKAAEYGWLW